MDRGPQTIHSIFLQGWSWNLSPSWGTIGMGCRSRVEVGMVPLIGPYFRVIRWWGVLLLVGTTSLAIGTRWQVTLIPRWDRLWMSRGPSSRWESTNTPQGHRHLGFMDNVQWLCFNNLGYWGTRGFTHHGPIWNGYLWLDNPSPWFGYNYLFRDCEGVSWEDWGICCGVLAWLEATTFLDLSISPQGPGCMLPVVHLPVPAGLSDGGHPSGLP